MNDLHERLKRLRAEGPENLELGICDNCEGSSDLIISIGVQWPEYSGILIFPVPCPDMNPADAFLALRDAHWNPDHTYGAARLRFLDWLIEQTAPDLALLQERKLA